MIEVREINADMTYSLRQSVLRPHQTIEDCKHDYDDQAGTFHVGAFYQGTLISIVSFNIEKNPDFKSEMQYRLRGMATLEEYRRLGAGKSIVTFAEKLIKEKGIDLLWCKARTTAQEYYKKIGFQTHGDIFDYPPLGPHIVMYKELT